MIIAFAILFGIVISIRQEMKDRRWAKQNPIEAAHWEWKINS